MSYLFSCLVWEKIYADVDIHTSKLVAKPWDEYQIKAKYIVGSLKLYLVTEFYSHYARMH